MILERWRSRKANREFIDQFHGKIVAAARRPELYYGLNVPDTVDGRFEMVILHASLVVRRLMREPGTGAELAQALTDSVFRHFDVALREMGYGDVAVVKRLKRMGEAFYGRAKAYSDGLDDHGSLRLVGALARNVYGATDASFAPSAPRLASLARAIAEALARTPVEAFAAGAFEFPHAGRFLADVEADHE